VTKVIVNFLSFFQNSAITQRKRMDVLVIWHGRIWYRNYGSYKSSNEVFIV